MVGWKTKTHLGLGLGSRNKPAMPGPILIAFRDVSASKSASVNCSPSKPMTHHRRSATATTSESAFPTKSSLPSRCERDYFARTYLWLIPRRKEEANQHLWVSLRCPQMEDFLHTG